MIEKKTTYEQNLYCNICERYLTDSTKDELIETGAPISGSVPVCPHCKKATFGDGLEYRKENPKEWVSVESLKEWCENKCIKENTQEIYYPHLLEELKVI